MINREVIKTIRDQEMDRKDFLKYCGLVLLSLVGLKTFISLLSQSDKQKLGIESHGKSTSGFGGGKYGV